MNSSIYALVGRRGDSVQVWRAMSNGDLLTYDGTATRRVTDYIVKNRAAPTTK